MTAFDDGWDATSESKLLLAGVLKAARELNGTFTAHGRPPAVLTFLRSDIWHELQFNDKNKFFADIELLEWSDNRLIEVAANRIKTSLGGTVADALDRVFSTKEMRQRASIRSYVLKRTMGRPRDVIVFCLKCEEVANEGSHEVVETDDVYEAETRYSQYVYGELDDEMGKQVPQARAYLQAPRDLGKTRFTLKEWVETLRSKERELTEAEARRRLGILFDYSIVGVPKRGGAGGGTTLLFNYQDRFLQPNFDEEIIVHPSLKKHLGLVEPRREAQNSEEDAQ